MTHYDILETCDVLTWDALQRLARLAREYGYDATVITDYAHYTHTIATDAPYSLMDKLTSERGYGVAEVEYSDEDGLDDPIIQQILSHGL